MPSTSYGGPYRKWRAARTAHSASTQNRKVATKDAFHLLWGTVQEVARRTDCTQHIHADLFLNIVDPTGDGKSESLRCNYQQAIKK